MSKYGEVSDLELLKEFERVSCAVNTAQQMVAKWTKVYAQTKSELRSVEHEICLRRLKEKDPAELQVGELLVGTVFDGSVGGDHFMLKVLAFNVDRTAVMLNGENDDQVSVQGKWALIDQVRVNRVVGLEEMV